MTEPDLFRTDLLVRQRQFGTIEELNAFLASEEWQQAIEQVQPQTPWERAQNLVYEAWASEPPERYRLARQALSIDDRCSDAWLILAEQERSWRKQRRFFERAVAAGEAYVRACGFLDAAGQPAARGDGGPRSLYRWIPGRIYLRALVALARCLDEGGYRQDAAGLYERILDLDPEDHMAIRIEVLPLYHDLNDRARLKALVDRFPNDGFAPLPYERLWLALVEGAPAEEVARLAAAAREVNPHVIAYLRGDAVWEGELPEYIHPGGEDEAASYAEDARVWWLDEPRAREWLLYTNPISSTASRAATRAVRPLGSK